MQNSIALHTDSLTCLSYIDHMYYIHIQNMDYEVGKNIAVSAKNNDICPKNIGVSLKNDVEGLERTMVSVEKHCC